MEMILDIISPLPPWVAHYCGQSFLHLAVAESKSHNVTPAEVYFHEVGAVDSIVDVCGFWCMLYLMGVQARNVSCSKLPTSEGTVKTDHGILPVPAPATARLMEGFDVTEGPRTAWGELCTPTGVAILRAALWDAEGERVDPGRVGRWKGRAGKVGTGGGGKEFRGHPNILRCFLGGEAGKAEPPPRAAQGKEAGRQGRATREERDDYWLKYGVDMPEFLAEGEVSAANEVLLPPPLPSPSDSPYCDDGDRLLTISKKALMEIVDGMVEAKMKSILIDGRRGGEARAASVCEEAAATVTTTATACSSSNPWNTSNLSVLTCNLDDVTAEVLSHVSSTLMSLGALDVWSTPIVMKKGRSGVELSLLGQAADASKYLDVIFRHTTTLGVRESAVSRHSLPRTFQTVNTGYECEGCNGRVTVKVGWMGEDAVTVHPEYEECKEVAEKTGVPIKMVIDTAKMELLKGGGELLIKRAR